MKEPGVICGRLDSGSSWKTAIATGAWELWIDQNLLVLDTSLDITWCHLYLYLSEGPRIGLQYNNMLDSAWLARSWMDMIWYLHFLNLKILGLSKIWFVNVWECLKGNGLAVAAGEQLEGWMFRTRCNRGLHRRWKMRRLKRLLPCGTFWRMEKHDIQSMRSIQEGLRAEVPPIFLLCAGPLHEDQPWFQGGLSCCMMFIVFRACRSSFSRFDLNWIGVQIWTNTLTLTYTYQFWIVFACTSHPFHFRLHLGIRPVGLDQFFFIVGRPHPSAGLGTGWQGRSLCFLATSKLSLNGSGIPVFTQFALCGHTILVGCPKGLRGAHWHGMFEGGQVDTGPRDAIEGQCRVAFAQDSDELYLNSVEDWLGWNKCQGDILFPAHCF